MSRFILWVLFLAAVRCGNNDDNKQLTESSFSGRKNPDRLRSRLIGIKNNMSSIRTKSNRAVSRECYDECTASFSFSDVLDVSTKCPGRVSASECSVDIIILYDTRSYTVNFIPESDEAGLEYMGVDSVMGQEISFQYPDNPTKSLSVTYFCNQRDGCEWSYAQQVINKFKFADLQPPYNALAALLHNSVENSVNRCYQQSSIVNCSRGLCTSFNDGSTFQVRGCVDRPSAIVRIDIESKRSTPASSTYDRDYFSYLCNHDLCNSPLADALVKLTIQSYSSVLEGLRENITTVGTTTLDTTSIRTTALSTTNSNLAGSKLTGELFLIMLMILSILALA